MRTAILHLLTWIAFLCAAMVFLTALGRGALATPSIADPAAWGPWVASRDPVVGAFALLRAATLVVAWYLLGATLVGAASRWLRLGRLVTVADLLTVPAVRRLIQSALGVGFATATLAAGSAPATAPPVLIAAVAAAPADEDRAETTPADQDAAEPVPFAPPPAPASASAEQRTWTVRAGEHFWSIAEAVLRRGHGSVPADDEVAAYWERLVDVNRPRLVDRDNPDLLYPGQTLRLPPAGADEGGG